jgi:hypothetical protein
MLLLRYLQRSSRFDKSLANLVALLRINPFTHRNLTAWLDEPFTAPPHPQNYRASLRGLLHLIENDIRRHKRENLSSPIRNLHCHT